MRRPITPRRTGQVLVTFTVALAVLCALAVLAVDMGHVMYSEARLQNAADSAGLASLLELWDQRAAGVDGKTARANAVLEAERIVSANCPGSACQVTWGYWIDGAFTVDISDDNGDDGKATVVDAVKIEALRDSSSPGGPTPTFFGKLFGLESVNQSAIATAHYRRRGLVPLAVDETDISPAGSQFTLYNETETVPGNCGILNFDGGENPTTEVQEWMYNGYHGPFRVDPETGHVSSDGTPGLKSSIKKPAQDLITAGETVVGCVYGSVTESGSNAIYDIVGYVAFTIEAVTMDKKGEEIISITATAASKYIPDTGETEGPMRKFMRLRLVK